ncbi:MAG: BrnA antitoxin family protein [Nitrospinae bacterium]|nr:BrnA antitoxin family protein [Nitrospinota bacterium]MCG2814200.1 BrnA antitoxin family protein [Thermodesulfovibrionales bacterium]
MRTKISKKELIAEEYYDNYGVLKDIVDEDIDLSLGEMLRKDIVSGKRKRILKNISIKIDPLYLQSIKKIATLKGIPYQTLVRQWLTENIRKELRIA